jgi:protein-tyrosine phosphatase
VWLDSTLSEKDFSEIYSIAEWVYSEWKSGKKVLVRYQAGWHRKGTVMALALMKDGYLAQEGIDLIRARRSPYALSNGHFVEYLEKLSSRDQKH